MKVSYCPKYGGPEVYQFIDIDKPKVKENEILIKVYRAIVSPTDVNFSQIYQETSHLQGYTMYVISGG